MAEGEAAGPSRSGIAIVVAVVLLAVLFALFSREDSRGRIGPGVPAPDFTLPRVDDGSSVSLASLRGRVVLINFWATWCKPCEDEMPAMERLYRRLAGPEFELLAVSVDDEREVVEAFRERLGLGFPILHDPRKLAARDYQAFRFPETVLVDRAGVITARFIGPREWDAPAYFDHIAELVRSGAEGP